ncbi:MAG: DNA-processing protein DprA [Bacteroidota bacterium]|nr:DNA-processing protein DprA [Bacteroidota bacterium]MDP4232395.1 DNA-processing protein DprA [Bacteroidota bacterium]MDP4241532.1 DNA-processing protein DprA [Bacteroidota bacterium]MDP4288266.1 DNA-processing protein DprA [Bacteroidota bacterium]
METTELTCYLALHLASGIGSRRLLALHEYFGSAERAIYAKHQEWMQVPGFGRGIADSLLASRDNALDQAAKQIARLPADTSIVTYYEETYPALLKSIDAPPALLFVCGNVQLLKAERTIAIVGSRKTSDYGRRAARELAERFARDGVTVVSGFAKGIDTQAHEATFEAGGSTIAILGSGVDVIYPTSNKQFATQLIESGRGIIASELPLGANPDARNFPWRNRIVSGLARATVVVESESDGGSMITASIAYNEKRDVYAIPGDLYRTSSSGPNRLIRESRARIATSPEQILTELGWSNGANKQEKKKPLDRTGLSMFEARIIDVLDAAGGPLVIDQIAERSGFEVQDLFMQLFSLEMKNLIRPMAGKQYTLSV